ncbi:MAG: phosphoglucosamine mutase, partial [Thalassovita sp.]|nr:phosphoglucosamine mutase [Thalassovita sp.]
ELSRVFEPVPQVLRNVRFDPARAPLEADCVQDAIAAGEKRLGSDGRLLIRKSGTEPLIRVMGESTDPALLDEVITSICETVETVC